MESSPVILESSSQEINRWKPGPEQMRLLKETYRRLGGKLPSREEVENLVTELKPYGFIEARRVYFWFRNQRQKKKTAEKAVRDTATSSLAPTPVTPSSASTSTAVVGPRFGTVSFFSPHVPIDVTTTIVCPSRPPVAICNTRAIYPLGLTYHFHEASNMVSHLYWNPRINIGMLDRGQFARSMGANSMYGGIEYLFSPVSREPIQELELFATRPEGRAGNVTAEDAAVGSTLRLGGNHLDLGRFRSSSDNLDGMDLTLKLGPPSN